VYLKALPKKESEKKRRFSSSLYLVLKARASRMKTDANDSVIPSQSYELGNYMVDVIQ
jgi:hypothetical protein